VNDAGPLAGIRVLDLSRVLAGPWATMTLADLGAEVWKVERPGDGDDTRSWKPPAAGETSTYFLATNRNKFGLAIDFGTERGRQLIRDLACAADVLVENYLAGTLERHGLDYASLAALNPRLVYCSISGYGRTGAAPQRAGYDFVIQAESGLMSINGDPAGEPQKFGVAISDLAAGMSATQAILAALFARERTRMGRNIDIALFDASIALLSNVASAALNADAPAKRYGNAHPSIVPYQTFAARDGSFVLACANNRQFGDLCRDVIEWPELAADPRFVTNSDRVARREVLVRELGAIFERMRLADVIARCRACNVPAGEIRSVADALASADVGARELIWTAEAAAPCRTAGSPLRFSGADSAPRRPPPRLGEHTAEVLERVLGLTPETIADLRTAGVTA
jgi:crotonobetainyl-CoA:carnitine CoA-transferase CaiB-like acyl-CoA transferase